MVGIILALLLVGSLAVLLTGILGLVWDSWLSEGAYISISYTLMYFVVCAISVEFHIACKYHNSALQLPPSSAKTFKAAKVFQICYSSAFYLFFGVLIGQVAFWLVSTNFSILQTFEHYLIYGEWGLPGWMQTYFMTAMVITAIHTITICLLLSHSFYLLKNFLRSSHLS